MTIAAALICYALALLYAPVAAQDRRLSRVEIELADALARVAWNEAAGSEPDLRLVWQTTRGHGTTPRARLRWLRAHSRCVTGGLPDAVARSRPGLCRWTRHLRADGAEPRGWDVERDGDWRRVRGPWLAHRARAVELVRAGDDAPDVCDETPTTWDGWRWSDRWPARALVPVTCHGTRNAGLVRRAR